MTNEKRGNKKIIVLAIIIGAVLFAAAGMAIGYTAMRNAGMFGGGVTGVWVRERKTTISPCGHYRAIRGSYFTARETIEFFVEDGIQFFRVIEDTHGGGFSFVIPHSRRFDRAVYQITGDRIDVTYEDGHNVVFYFYRDGNILTLNGEIEMSGLDDGEMFRPRYEFIYAGPSLGHEN
jgi:hypothetical protein